MKFLLRAGIAVTTIVLIAAGALWWLLGSESGLRWLLDRAQHATGGQLSTQNARGSLVGAMQFDHVRYQAGGASIEASGVQLDIDAGAVFQRMLAIDRLHVDRLVVRLPEPSQSGTPDQEPLQPPGLPNDLSLPFDVRVDPATIGTLEVRRGDTSSIARDVSLSYAGGTERHQLRALRGETPWGRVAAEGELGTSRPFPIDATLSVDDPNGAIPPHLPGRLQLRVGGTFNELQANAGATAGDMQAQARASLAPFTRPWPQMLQSLQLHGQAIDLARFGAGLPQTQLSLDANASAAANATLQGRLQANNAHAGSLDRGLIPLASVLTGFSTDFTKVSLDGLRIGLEPGGRLAGDAQLQFDPLSAELELRGDDLDLRALRSTLRETALDGPLRIAVQGPSRQQVSGVLEQQGLRISAQARRDGDTVMVEELDLRAYGGRVSGNGRVAIGEPARFDAALRIARFDPAQLGDYPRGSINGSAAVQGTLGETPHVRANWVISDSSLRGQPLGSRGSVQVDGRRVARIDASATLGRNRAEAHGAFGAARDRLRWRIDAPALAQLAEGVAGQVRGHGTLIGTPSDGRLTLQLTGSELRLPAGIGARRASMSGEVGLPPDAPLDLHLNARGIVAPRTALDEIELDTDGTVGRHTATLSARAQQQRLELRMNGGWQPKQGPSGAWVGAVQALVLRGLPGVGDGGSADVRLAAPAPLTVARERVVLRDVALDVGGGSARIEQVAWQPDRWATSGRFESLPSSLLTTFIALPAGMVSTLRFDGSWSMVASPRLDGTLMLQRSAGDLTLAGPPAVVAGIDRASLQVRFDDGRLRADLLVDARLGTITGQATIAPEPGAGGIGIGAASPLTAEVRLDIQEIRLIAEPLQTFGRVSGGVQASLDVTGTLGRPRTNGMLQADDLSIEVPPYGIYLRQGALRARLDNDTLRVERFEIHAGDGTFTAAGTLPLRAGDGGAELAWKAEDFRVLNRPDMRLVVTGQGEVGFDGEEFALRGEVRADRGRFEIVRNRLPDLGADVVVIGEEQPAEEAARMPLDLDLRIDLGDDLRLLGLGLQGRVKGSLHLTTNETAELRAHGRIETVDATFSAYGQELVVDPGVLIFDGPIDDPTLQITAWRRNQQVEAGVQITGSAQAPRVSLVSDPPVAEGERLSWLVLGRPPGDAAGGDIALLQAAAGAFMGRGGGVPLTDRIANALGLDEFAIRSSREIASQVVAFGKQLSDRLSVTYEHGLDAAAENLVKLDYALTRRISLRAETGSSSGFGVLYRFAWD